MKVGNYLLTARRHIINNRKLSLINVFGLSVGLMSCILIKQDKVFGESIIFADQPFFELFDLPFLYGSSETSFVKPRNLVVTNEMALKYFG